MKPLIKWPGGKTGEINKIRHLIPEFSRYVEPFFGGGALFFHLRPECAVINDLSQSLMEYYSLVKAQDRQLHRLLLSYNDSFKHLISQYDNNYGDILNLYTMFKKGCITTDGLNLRLTELTKRFAIHFDEGLRVDMAEFIRQINKSAADKFRRTVVNNGKQSFSPEDLKDNLLAGFTGGYYMYFRRIFNDIALGKINVPEHYRAANFYFIREFCYGSMFRYNRDGQFNIPYGGMSYNKKDFSAKIKNMFNSDAEKVFRGAEIHCRDFQEFFDNVNLIPTDFVFLDPPYDTDFSDYEGRAFTRADQERLAYYLRAQPAQFILVIKNTDFINGLYQGHFNVLAFDNQYTYNVRSRNRRGAEHLIITNLPVG